MDHAFEDASEEEQYGQLDEADGENMAHPEGILELQKSVFFLS